MSQRRQYWSIKDGGDGKGNPRTLRVFGKYPEGKALPSEKDAIPSAAQAHMTTYAAQRLLDVRGIPSPVSGDATIKARHYPKGHRMSTCL